MTLHTYLSKPYPLPTSLIYSSTKILIKTKDHWFAYEPFKVVSVLKNNLQELLLQLQDCMQSPLSTISSFENLRVLVSKCILL
jgi:hypothetical protein